jgi:hypothetical protein
MPCIILTAPAVHLPAEEVGTPAAFCPCALRSRGQLSTTRASGVSLSYRSLGTSERHRGAPARRRSLTISISSAAVAEVSTHETGAFILHSHFIHAVTVRWMDALMGANGRPFALVDTDCNPLRASTVARCPGNGMLFWAG